MAKRPRQSGLVRTGQQMMSTSRSASSAGASARGVVNSACPGTDILTGMTYDFRQDANTTANRSDYFPSSNVGNSTTFSFRFRVDDATATDGILFEMGTSAASFGTTYWMTTGGVLHGRCGISGDMELSYTSTGDGEVIEVVVGIDNVNHKHWINGAKDPATAARTLNQPWANAPLIGYGLPNGSVAHAGAAAVTLAGATLLSPLCVFIDKLPPTF